MKFTYLSLLVSLIFLSCKKVREESNLEILEPVNEEIIRDSTLIKDENFYVKKSHYKQKQLEEFKKEIPLKQLVIERKEIHENNKTELDFYYPYLNEEINRKYKSYNKYVDDSIVNKTMGLMKDNEAFISLCDTIETRKQKSHINYSVKENKRLLSTVFVIENYYSGANKSSVSFQTVNYDLLNFKVIDYHDYFKASDEIEVLKVLNSVIRSNIDSGDLYYDCWEISKEDFNLYKDNFTVDNDKIRFYFDDCVVCPSYTGTYYVEVASEHLRPYVNSDYLIQSSFDTNL